LHRFIDEGRPADEQ